MRHALSPQPLLHICLLLLVFALVPLPANAAPGDAPRPAAASAAPAAASLPTPQQAAQAAALLRDETQRNALLTVLDTIARTAPVTPPAAPGDPAGAPAPATEPAADTAAPDPDAVVEANGLLPQLLARASNTVRGASGQVAAGVAAFSDLDRLWFWLRNLVTRPERRAMLGDAALALLLIFGCGLAAEWLTRRALRRPQQVLLGRGEARLPPAVTAPPPPAPPPAAETEAASGESAADLSPDPMPPAPGTPAVPSAAVARAERRRRALQAAGKMLRRLPLAVARLVLNVLPLVAFAVMVNLLLGSGAGLVDSADTRVIVLAATGAYLGWRTALALSAALVSPDAPALRLLALGDRPARAVQSWVGRLFAVGLFGAAALEIARQLGIFSTTYTALWKLLILVQHVLVVIMILQARPRVARALHAPQNAHGVFAVLRNLAAMVWHLVAIFLVIALWVVWALGVEDGYARILRFLLETFLVLGIMRGLGLLALGGLDQLFRLRDADAAAGASARIRLEHRVSHYYPAARRVAVTLLWAVTAAVLLQVWGLDIFAWLMASDSIGRRLVWAAMVVLVAAAVAILTWETANLAIDRRLSRLSDGGDLAGAARLRTLLPLLRSVLLVVVGGIVILTALSELGLNIGPLLAGAGIVGVAVGFGSQKLVQDVITGIFLLLENTMQVGDFVTAAGLSGNVEALSIRTVRLRAGDGSVHVIPFSAVDKVTNNNRGIGNAEVKCDVAPDSDIDRVFALLKEISAGMRADADYKSGMLDDIAVWGVDRVDAGGIGIVGQIRCTDAARWGVQREFKRRMKLAFDREGIRLSANTNGLTVSVPLYPPPPPPRPD